MTFELARLTERSVEESGRQAQYRHTYTTNGSGGLGAMYLIGNITSG